MKKEILVYAGWVGKEAGTKLGLLRAEQIGGEEIFTFEYDSEWLKRSESIELDPELGLFEGPQRPSKEKINFGFFLDSSPDRWGRTLLQRREILIADKEDRSPRTLKDSDYLLGLEDETRMGALRFKLEENGDFMNNNPELAAPPMSSIRELEEASLQIEDENFFEHREAINWLRLILAPGSSLGGARPKANVKDTEKKLWIAKFPSRNDEINKGAWEFLVYKLAISCAIQMSKSSCQRYGKSRHHTFLTKGCDRMNTKKRIHFASAMTLLGHIDGYSFRDGASYLDMVDLIERIGIEPETDIRELWKRITFSVLISNTDDHLRNHGFLLTDGGWKLSPAYDLNPNPQGFGLSLNISENDNRLSEELCLEVAELFRWKNNDAYKYLNDSKKVIGNWKDLASKIGISNAEKRRMAPAFKT